jgi:hypothetical protein
MGRIDFLMKTELDNAKSMRIDIPVTASCMTQACIVDSASRK